MDTMYHRRLWTNSNEISRSSCRSSTNTSSAAGICSTCSIRPQTCPATTSISSGSSAATTRTPTCRCSGEPSLQRRELCNVPISQAGAFLKTMAEKKRGAGYTWDHLAGKWVKLDWRQVRPGMTILLPTAAGGYDWDDESKRGKGWDAESKTLVTPLPPEQKVKEEAVGSDPNSAVPVPLTIAEHT